MVLPVWSVKKEICEMLDSSQYFHPQEVIVLHRALTYGELSAVALAQLTRMSKSLMLPSIVCGPISTGGLGDKMLNIARFEQVVNHFVSKKHGAHFNQIPFEEPLWRVQDYRKTQEPDVTHPLGAGNPLLEEFYRPLFESGFIGAMYFIKGWQSSIGSTWEHELGGLLGIERFYLDDAFEVSREPFPAP